MPLARIVSLILLLAGAAVAQNALECTANSGVPPTVRAGGKTELVSDLLLICSGGIPTAANSPVPVYTLEIQSKSALAVYNGQGTIVGATLAEVNITSRELAASTSSSEAILMVDEPHSTTNPSVPLLACGDTLAPATNGVCTVNGTGTGQNTYNGSAGRPNVFQAKQIAPDTIAWTGVPIDPPPFGETRTIRITNVRLNANQAPPAGSSLLPTLLLEYPSLSSAAGSVPITTSGAPYGGNNGMDIVPGAQVAAFIQDEITAVYSGSIVPVTLPQCQSDNLSAFGSSSPTLTYTMWVEVKEGFQSSFRRKNWGTDISPDGDANPAGTSYPAGGDLNQNIPGVVYNTESAFENIGPTHDPVQNPPPQLSSSGIPVPATAAFPALNGLVGAGVADQGTRVALAFNSVPSGVAIYVPTAVELTSQLTGVVTGQAVLVSTDAFGAGTFSPVESNGGSIAGGANASGLALVKQVSGSGIAVYEILYADAFNAEQLAVPIAISYAANAPAANILATLTVETAPFSGAATADPVSPVPRFGAGGVVGVGTPEPLFEFKSCSQLNATTLTLTSSANTVPNGSSVTFRASVFPSSVTGQVALYEDFGTLLASSNLVGGVATFAETLNLSAGPHSIMAVYTGTGASSVGTAPITISAITPVEVSPGFAFPTAYAGVFYGPWAPEATAVSGGVPPYSFSAVSAQSNALTCCPSHFDQLEFDSNGNVSGIPAGTSAGGTVPGTFSITYQAEDSLGQTASGQFLLEILNPAANPTWAGVFTNGIWQINTGGDQSSVQQFTYGQAGDVPIAGDWTNNGTQRIGIFRNGQWWLDLNNDHNWTSPPDTVFVYGQAGDIPIFGDWDNTGVNRIGIFRNGQWWLDINNDHQWTEGVDEVFVFGQAGDIPVFGDWDGSGKKRIGVFRNGEWWLDINGDHQWTQPADTVFIYGQAGDVPVVGNWAPDGPAHVGIFRNGQWWLDYNGDHRWINGQDEVFTFGGAGSKPIPVLGAIQ